MAAYYNENEPYPAQWLRNLIKAGLIAAGDVDDRSILDVRSDDLIGYSQCHFFAGLGGWSNALRRAGWPDDRPVWTGSCPCQPFSVAGKQKGFSDERHLWPAWRDLIAERLPTDILGEQVASASEWLRIVRSDLEAMDYAVGALPLQAASAHADHFRDRYWFVANMPSQRGGRVESAAKPTGRRGAQDNRSIALADSDSVGSQISIGEPGDAGTECSTSARSGLCNVVDTESHGWGEGWTEHEFRSRGFTAAVASIDDCQYIECPDGKWRRLPPPGVRWLGNGIPARVAKLRAIGNAIDPRPASKFIEAVMSLRP